MKEENRLKTQLRTAIMSRDSNLYTFLFVGIMIVGIASILAYTSQTLKPMQDENVKNEKMQNILSTVGINVSKRRGRKSYKKYIVEELALKKLMGQ